MPSCAPGTAPVLPISAPKMLREEEYDEFLLGGGLDDEDDDVFGHGRGID